MDILKCIYCLEEKDASCFRNREHVLPEAFGKFKNNLVLHGVVCNKCNSGFGETLELVLGRSTIEGVVRYMSKLKKAKDFKFMGKTKRFTVMLAEGFWKNALMELGYDETKDEIIVVPVPQIGFRKKGTTEWTYFRIEEIESVSDLKAKGFVVQGKGASRLIYETGEKGKAIKELKKKGIKDFDSGKDVALESLGEKIKTQLTGIIDEPVLRAIAKIAFNYAAYVEGKQFVLEGNFDGIRRFIRLGEGDAKQFIRLEKKWILEEERRTGMRLTSGHLVTLSWDSYDQIVSQVSLFNTVKYSVALCKRYSGIWRKIRHGHHFDIDTKTVGELHSLPKNFYIPGYF